jgi:hypothetical protein
MNDPLLFTKGGRELIVSDAATENVRWTGLVEGQSAEYVLPLLDGLTAIVLLDYMARRGPFRNLVCVDGAGSVLWRAQLPTEDSSEAYTAVEVIGHEI